MEDLINIQDAVWFQMTRNEENKPVVSSTVALKVRWTDKKRTVEVTDGDELNNMSSIWVGEVTHVSLTQENIKLGDYLWLGVLGSQPADPFRDRDCLKILSRKRIPDFENEITYYKFMG